MSCWLGKDEPTLLMKWAIQEDNIWGDSMVHTVFAHYLYQPDAVTSRWILCVTKVPLVMVSCPFLMVQSSNSCLRSVFVLFLLSWSQLIAYALVSSVLPPSLYHLQSQSTPYSSRWCCCFWWCPQRSAVFATAAPLVTLSLVLWFVAVVTYATVAIFVSAGYRCCHPCQMLSLVPPRMTTDIVFVPT